MKRSCFKGCFCSKAAFTLIELLVVVLIIGILAAVAVPQYQKAVEKARMTEAITLLSSAAQAEKVYFLANGEYTDDFEALDMGFGEISTNVNNGFTRAGNLYITRAQTDHYLFVQPVSGNIYWLVLYYLDEGKIYCGTRETEEKGLALCKSFGGTESVACGNKGKLVCYEIK